MMEQYRVLSAMLALREFTVSDLSLYSEVKSNTVWNTLTRERRYIEELGKDKTGRKGGQPRRWRVRTDQLDNLKAKLSSAFVHIRNSPGMLNDETESEPQVPVGLLVAEDTLLRLYPKATTAQQRRELLELAEINFDAGRSECENLISGSEYTGDMNAIRQQLHSVETLLEEHTTKEILDAHMHSVASLIELSRLEYDLDHNRDPKPEISVQALYHDLTTASHELWDVGVRTVAFATMQRVAKSPVINRALAW